jgi:hypothetical protein
MPPGTPEEPPSDSYSPKCLEVWDSRKFPFEVPPQKVRAAHGGSRRGREVELAILQREPALASPRSDGRGDECCLCWG